MLARRLQRRHNIKTTLSQCLVLAGYRPTVMLTWLSSDVEPMSGQCWLTVCYAGPVFTRSCFNVSCFVSFIQSHALVAAASQAVGQRYRCWASIKCFVLCAFTGQETYWAIACDAGPTLNHHVNVSGGKWWTVVEIGRLIKHVNIKGWHIIGIAPLPLTCTRRSANVRPASQTVSQH